MEELRLRVARLEAENGRLRRIGVAALLLFALPLLSAAAPRRGSSFRINTLAIVDSENRVRARLGVENGEPGLLLLDENGVVRTAHCAHGWLRADASGRRIAAAGKPTCVPGVPAEAPVKKAIPAEKE